MTARRLRTTLWLLALILLSKPALAADDFDGLYRKIQAANGGSGSTITLGGPISLSAALPPITGSVAIDGGGHSISGSDAYRIFDVNGGALKLSNVTLTGGNATEGDGGAIRMRNGAELTIERSTFSANTATYGGAIATSSGGDRLSVSDSSFSGNIALKSAGAIYANGGTVNVTNSSFEKNCAQSATLTGLSEGDDRESSRVDSAGCLHVNYYFTEFTDYIDDRMADVDAGAIRLRNGARVEIEDSTFSENKATYGGAIATASNNIQLNVSGSSFVANRARASGGAIGGTWSGGGRITVSSSSFVENVAARYDGGAIHAFHHRLEIANSTFSENVADGAGGAIKIEEYSQVTITHATFFENKSRTSANAIRNAGGKAYLRNSIIASSESGEDCVGAWEHVGNLSTDGTCADRPGDDPRLGELTGSPAYFPLRDRSPAVDYADPKYCLEADQVGASRPQGGACDIGAIEARGVIAAEPTPVPPLVCTLAHQIVAANRDRPSSGCPAGSGVDTIVLDRDITLFEPLPAIASSIIIEGNGHSISGERKFRIFDVGGGILTVRNLTMTEGLGGAIRLQNGGRAIVSDSRFVKNSGNRGAAVFIDYTGTDRSSLTVNRSSFVENWIGAIFARGGTITVSDSSFFKNSSVAISIVNPSTRLDVVNSSFIKNGKAIFAENGATANLTHVTICCHGSPLGTYSNTFTTTGNFKFRNSIVVGYLSDEICDNMKQNIGNLFTDDSCAPALNGDPMLEAPADSATFLSPLPGSPAIDAADPRFCLRTDQLGRERPRFSLCDIGAVESIPVSRPISDCAVTTTHTLNFREQPGGARFGTVPENATVQAAARTSGWFQVEYRGTSGWISADYVETQGECG